MKRLAVVIFVLTVVIYSENEKTRKIKVYDYNDETIEHHCAEGVSRSECMNPKPREKKEVDSISYEDIQNFVIRGPYSF
jgi:hypothetical protein